MNYTNRLIDQFKAARGIASDYAAAKELDVTQPTMSNYRRFVSHADDRVCITVAKTLGLDPLQTIARVNLDRARTEKERKFWKSIVNAAAALLVFIYSSAFSTCAETAPHSATHISDRVYIMSNTDAASANRQPASDQPAALHSDSRPLYTLPRSSRLPSAVSRQPSVMAACRPHGC